MGQNPYQFQIVAAGAVRQAGALTFTDAGNQPGGSSAFLTATVPLTDTQISHLPTTSIEIVPTPGPGKAIVYLNGIVIVDSTAGQYGNIDYTDTSFTFWVGHEVSAQVRDAPGGSTSPIEELLLGNIGCVFVPPASIYNVTSLVSVYGQVSTFEDSPLILSGANGALGDFSGGNAANSGSLTVYYAVVDLPT